MARARIYIRRSNDDQSTYSPEAQERQNRLYCELHGHTMVKVYLDDDLSGTKEDRNAFQQLQLDACADPGSLVIIHKIDRLARDAEVVLRTIKKFDRFNVALVSVSEQIDFSTPIGRVMLTNLAAFAEYYSRNLATEIKKGLYEKAERGGWIGLPPYGYRAIHEYDYKGERIRGSHRIVPSDDALTVRRIFCEYATGSHSDSSLRDLLHEEGIAFLHPKTGQRVPFQRDSVGGILRNPAYIGIVRCGGREYPGVHEPLIDRDLWDRCHAIRQRRTRQNGGRVPVRGIGGLLSELAYCGLCGARLRWWASGEGESRQGYYRCARHVAYGREACGASMIQAKRIEAQLLDVARDLVIPQCLRDLVLFEAQRQLQAPRSAPTIDRERIQRQLERLRAVFLSGDEGVSEAFYQSESARLKAQLAADAPVVNPAARLDVERALQFLSDIPAMLDGAALAHQRAVLQQLFTTVWLEKQQVTAVQPSSLFLPLLVAADNLYATSTGADRARGLRAALWTGFAVPALV